jgi:transglutaminase-like putative cysteine protease
MVGWRRLVASGPPEHSVPLRLWTMAAAITSVLAVTAHDDFLEYRLTVPVLLALGFAFSYWRRGKRNWWIKVILALLCLRVGYAFLRDVFADPFHTSIPLTVLLLWLQVLHSFDVPARRDLLFSLLSSVIMMAVAAAFAVDLAFLGFLALYAFAAVQALVHNAWQAGREAVALAPGAPAPAGERRPPGSTAEADGRGLARAANHLLAVVLAGTVAAFLATPRFEGFRWTALPFSPQRALLNLFAGRIFNPAYPGSGGGNGEGQAVWNPRGYFGFGTSVNLRLRGRLDDALVMRVRSTHRLNWRALAFDTYTGSGWLMADQAVSRVEGFPPITLPLAPDEVFSYRARTVRVTQTFYVDQEQPNVIFAAPLAQHLYVSSGGVFADRYGSIRLGGTLQPGVVYSVVSLALAFEPQRLRAASGLVPAHITARYLQLPPMPERVGALARAITAGQPTQYDRVVAVARHLWRHYRYDLTIPPQRGDGDAVDYFLFEERRGYCEQFASAMAVLLRAAGIPARLVTGYTSGTLNPVTGLFEVRNSDAHAWVEVFFPGMGWVEFEPTPGFPETAALGRPAARRWVWQDLGTLVRDRLASLAARSPTAARLLRALAAAVRGGMVAAVLLAAAVAAAGLWRAAGRRAQTATPHAPGLEGIYRQMCALLARCGLRRRPSETVGEYARRVEAERSLPEVGAISALVERAAYAGRPPDPEDIEVARRALEALGARLRRRYARR